MPLYTWDEEIMREMQLHAELRHSNREDVDYHVMQDGSVACREPLCFWHSKHQMPLSKNDKSDN